MAVIFTSSSAKRYTAGEERPGGKSLPWHKEPVAPPRLVNHRRQDPRAKVPLASISRVKDFDTIRKHKRTQRVAAAQRKEDKDAAAEGRDPVPQIAAQPRHLARGS